ncbi:hypothetical protein SDC9_73964 [bioreactor metagenome]|uniref:Uncharacterized protein n=1 Tax=bioreactor metagenome TaxID=1076179 RepID=A0A644YLU1_9ZZZZ
MRKAVCDIYPEVFKRGCVKCSFKSLAYRTTGVKYFYSLLVQVLLNLLIVGVDAKQSYLCKKFFGYDPTLASQFIVPTVFGFECPLQGCIENGIKSACFIAFCNGKIEL